MLTLSQHPALAVFAAFWLFSAFAGGMPPPTDRSGLAYLWLHNSLQIAAGNLKNAIAVRYPALAEEEGKLPEVHASAHAAREALLFVASNLGFFHAKAIMLRDFFVARFPLRKAAAPTPNTLYAPMSGATMSTPVITPNPAPAQKTENGFERFIDKLVPFLKKEAPVLEQTAEAARPILALTPFGPEYNLVLTGIETAVQADLAMQAAGGTALSGPQKMGIALSVATPQVTAILASKGITTPAIVSSEIQKFAQNVYNLQTGAAATAAGTNAALAAA